MLPRMISVCMTMKNRAGLLAGKLANLLTMNYPPEQLEVCILDGGSSQDLLAVLRSYKGRFGRIIYARGNRGKLNMTFPPGCLPVALDYNAQVRYLARAKKIVRTDPEIRFTNPDSLLLIEQTLETPRTALVFQAWEMRPKFRWPKHRHKLDQFLKRKYTGAFYCTAFRKDDFIEAGGIEEQFAQTFAGEDSHFHWWWAANRKVIVAPEDHLVLHLHHESQWSREAKQLRNRVTKPLLARLKKTNARPNMDNPDWGHPEMLEDVTVWG